MMTGYESKNQFNQSSNEKYFIYKSELTTSFSKYKTYLEVMSCDISNQYMSESIFFRKKIQIFI